MKSWGLILLLAAMPAWAQVYDVAGAIRQSDVVGSFQQGREAAMRQQQELADQQARQQLADQHAREQADRSEVARLTQLAMVATPDQRDAILNRIAAIDPVTAVNVLQVLNQRDAALASERPLFRCIDAQNQTFFTNVAVPGCVVVSTSSNGNEQ